MESASGRYEPLTLKHAEGLVDGLAEGQEAITLQAGQSGGKRKSRVNGPSTKPLLGPQKASCLHGVCYTCGFSVRNLLTR
jgi:hypothetical protein